MRPLVRLRTVTVVSAVAFAFSAHAQPVLGEALRQPFALPYSAWNTDISWAPVYWPSWDFINFLNRFGTLSLPPNLGGNWWEDPGRNFGYPYIVVDDWQPKVTVQFADPAHSDGVGYPFYPIPDEAIWYSHWIE